MLKKQKIIVENSFHTHSLIFSFYFICEIFLSFIKKNKERKKKVHPHRPVKYESPAHCMLAP